MILSVRTMLILLSVSLLLACLSIRPGWMARHGADFWNYSRYEEEIRQGQKATEHFDVLSRRVQQRISLKNIIVMDLISTRVDLAGATDQFLELNKVDSELLCGIYNNLPTSAARELTADQVLGFVRVELKGDPSRLDRTLRELRRQRRALRECAASE